MEKENYHHGALKEELIQKGIELIRAEGVEKFSLRKVAVLCHVSHAAPYKHFKSKEELIEAIVQYVLDDFTIEIQKTAKENPGEKRLIETGKRYVTYMLEHRDYFQFMFQSSIKASVKIEGDQFIYSKGHPFEAFYIIANDFLSEMIPNQSLRNRKIFQYWCAVHGLAHLLISDIVDYNGDYAMLTELMLRI